MLDEHDRHPPAPEVPQQGAQPLPVGRIEARRRFVEQQHPRVGDQGACHLHQPPSAVWQISDRRVLEVAEVELLDHLFSPRRRPSVAALPELSISAQRRSRAAT